MKVKVKSTILRYGLALLLFAVTVGIALLLSYYSFKINLTILIVVALVAAAWYGGRGPGILLAFLLQGTTVLTENIPPDSSIAKAYFGYFSVFSLLIFIVWLISERKHVEKGLRSSLKELADIKFALDESAIVAITDQKGKINFVNDKFCEISGYSREELIGQDHRIINSEFHSIGFISNLWKIIANGKVWKGEIKNRAKNGSYYWVDTTIVPFLNEEEKPYQYIAIRNDITGRKLAEDKILKEKYFSDTLINSLPGIFYLFDQNGKFLRWNDNFERVTGYSVEEISSLHPLDLFVGKDKENISVRIGEVFAQGESTAEANLVSKTGESTPYYFTGKNLLYKNELCLVGMGIDITERDAAEKEMYKLASIVEYSHSAIISKDFDGIIQSWNKGAERIFGYKENEMIGRSILDLIPKELQDEEKVILEKIKSGLVVDNYVTIRVKEDGTDLPVSLTISPIKNKKGEIIGVSKIATDISEQIVAKVELQKSEERYRDLFENNPFPMMVYDYNTLDILAVNDAAILNYGYSREEFGEMSMLQIRPSEELPQFLQQLKKPHTAIDNFGIWKHQRKNGEIISVDVISHELIFDGKDARLVLANDVTERKRAEEKLIENQRQFRELSESLPQLVWTCRGDGYCEYLSPQWVNYTGIPEAEQLGSEWVKQIHPEDRDATFKKWNIAVESKRPLDIEYRLKRWDGEYRWFKTLAVPHTNSEGVVVRWFGTNTDIEETKKAEKEIHLLNETLEQRVSERTSELEVSNKELESFSYSVSHDLRAPLRAIDGFSRALLEDCAEVLDDDGKHYLGRVRTASQQMAQLIEDLLKLSRVTRREINRSEVNLSNLAKLIVENLRERNPERNIEFNLEEDVVVYGDEGLLRIVLENLLENAWKFTSKKEKAEINFGSKILDKETHYFVSDNGAGFDMTYADKLFGAFQRLHGTCEFEGTGIGLATVHRILLRHGGTIRAESEIGKGTVFYFTV